MLLTGRLCILTFEKKAKEPKCKANKVTSVKSFNGVFSFNFNHEKLVVLNNCSNVAEETSINKKATTLAKGKVCLIILNKGRFSNKDHTGIGEEPPAPRRSKKTALITKTPLFFLNSTELIKKNIATTSIMHGKNPI